MDHGIFPSLSSSREEKKNPYINKFVDNILSPSTVIVKPSSKEKGPTILRPNIQNHLYYYVNKLMWVDGACNYLTLNVHKQNKNRIFFRRRRELYG